MSRQQSGSTSSNPALSHRAEVFRAKLIDNFQLLETISEQGRRRAPVYCSSDVLGMSIVVVAVMLTSCTCMLQYYLALGLWHASLMQTIKLFQ